MILATRSGWLMAVDKLSETTHTVTIQGRDEVTAPFTVSKSDPDQRLFDNTDEASAWIDDHPARKGSPAMTTNKPEVAAYRYTASRSFGKRNRKWHYQESFPHAANREVAEIGQMEELIRLSDYKALQAECEKLRKDAETERAIQRAAEVLPTGFRIEIEIEKDYGGVALFSPGAIVECDFQGGIAEQIADAIDAAIQEGSP